MSGGGSVNGRERENGRMRVGGARETSQEWRGGNWQRACPGKARGPWVENEDCWAGEAV